MFESKKSAVLMIVFAMLTSAITFIFLVNSLVNFFNNEGNEEVVISQANSIKEFIEISNKNYKGEECFTEFSLANNYVQNPDENKFFFLIEEGKIRIFEESYLNEYIQNGIENLKEFETIKVDGFMGNQRLESQLRITKLIELVAFKISDFENFNQIPINDFIVFIDEDSEFKYYYKIELKIFDHSAESKDTVNTGGNIDIVNNIFFYDVKNKKLTLPTNNDEVNLYRKNSCSLKEFFESDKYIKEKEKYEREREEKRQIEEERQRKIEKGEIFIIKKIDSSGNILESKEVEIKNICEKIYDLSLIEIIENIKNGRTYGKGENTFVLKIIFKGEEDLTSFELKNLYLKNQCEGE